MFIIANSKDIDSGDQFGRTPLIFCVLADRHECAEILLKAGCKVDKKDETGRTALHWAAHKVLHTDVHLQFIYLLYILYISCISFDCLRLFIVSKLFYIRSYPLALLRYIILCLYVSRVTTNVLSYC